MLSMGCGASTNVQPTEIIITNAKDKASHISLQCLSSTSSIHSERKPSITGRENGIKGSQARLMAPVEDANFYQRRLSAGSTNNSYKEIIRNNEKEKNSSHISLRPSKSCPGSSRSSGRRVSIADARKRREDDVKVRQRRLSAMASIEAANLNYRKLSIGSYSVSVAGSQSLDSSRKSSLANCNIKTNVIKRQLSNEDEQTQTIGGGGHEIRRNSDGLDGSKPKNNSIVFKLNIGEHDNSRDRIKTSKVFKFDEPERKPRVSLTITPTLNSNNFTDIVDAGKVRDHNESKKYEKGKERNNSWDLTPENKLDKSYHLKGNMKHDSERNTHNYVKSEELRIEHVEDGNEMDKTHGDSLPIIKEPKAPRSSNENDFENTERRPSQRTLINNQAHNFVQNVLNMAVLQLSKP